MPTIEITERISVPTNRVREFICDIRRGTQWAPLSGARRPCSDAEVILARRRPLHQFETFEHQNANTSALTHETSSTLYAHLPNIMERRTYHPDEIHKLLERAVELQATASSRESETGLTLAELETVARASGIDPAYLHQAAIELETPESPASPPTSTHIFAERTVYGDLSDEAWMEVLVELRRRFEISDDDAASREEQRGATRSWHHGDDNEVETQVYITPREGRLHIRMSQYVAWADSVTESLVYSGISAVILGTLATTLVEGPMMTVAAYVLALLLSFPVIYGLDRRWRNVKQRELDEVAESLARRLQSTESLKITDTETRSSDGDQVSMESFREDIDIEDLDDSAAAEDIGSRRERGRSGPVS